MRIVVIGGGYAGLPCLIELHRRKTGAELHLIDPRSEHCKLTRLHETLQTPLQRFCEPFSALGSKYGFIHHREAIDVTEEKLNLWSAAGRLPLAHEDLSFDALVVATGSRPRKLPSGEGVYTQEDFRKDLGREVIESIAAANNRSKYVTVVGAGATGVQFLFELSNVLRKKKTAVSLRLISLEERTLAELPAGLHRVVLKRLAEAGIDFVPCTRYMKQARDRIIVEDLSRHETFDLPSRHTLLFPGVAPFPLTLNTDRFGRVLAGDTLENVFAAGDCSIYQGHGLNRLSAQAAMRKGKLVAANIRAQAERKTMSAYTYRESGYMVSLGRHDAVGWLGLRTNIVKGLPALACKEALESQYNLYLGGVDTYLPFFSII